MHLADDYEIACKIRCDVSAIEASGNLDEKMIAWITWAIGIADWYDPTIARVDDIFRNDTIKRIGMERN